MVERLHFDSIKERNYTFFVEYNPPIHNTPFATLSITFPAGVEIYEVINLIECQAKKWLERYPIPVMVSAFDKFGGLIDLSDIKGSSHLISFKRNNKIECHWELLNDEQFPQDALNVLFLLDTYSDIKYRTQSEVNEAALKKANSMKHFRMLLTVWTAFIPAIIAVWWFLSPTWIAALALAYSLWKIFQQWRLMTGRAKKSEKDIAKEKEYLRMKYHHYHCELNPDGFLRLKIENFNHKAEEHVRNEFNSIQKSN